MKATQLLHNLGQSIWLDNITRDLLDSGTLKHYVDELSVTGLTSNPTIFDHAIKNSTAYDSAIRDRLSQGKSGEALFFELALARDEIFFLLPVRLERIRLLADMGKLFFQDCQALPRVGVVFLLERLLLDFELHGTTLELVDLGRHGVDLNAQ